MFFFPKSAAAAPSIEDIYVMRTGTSGYDKTLTDWIRDAGWHDMDLSAIVPANVKTIHCRMTTNGGGTEKPMSLRRKGETNGAFLVPCGTPPVDCDWSYDFWLDVDANREIEYYCTTGPWTTINFLIKGWILPGT